METALHNETYPMELLHTTELLGPSEVHLYGEDSDRLVLFMHGANEKPQSYEQFYTDLHDVTGARIAAPSGPGIGASTQLETGEDIGHRASLLLEHFIGQYGLSNITLIGHSHGGWEALGALETVNRLRREGNLRTEDMYGDLKVVTIATPNGEVDSKVILRSLMSDSLKRKTEAARSGNPRPLFHTVEALVAAHVRIVSDPLAAKTEADKVMAQMDAISTPQAQEDRMKLVASDSVLQINYRNDSATPIHRDLANPIILDGHHMTLVEDNTQTLEAASRVRDFIQSDVAA